MKLRLIYHVQVIQVNNIYKSLLFYLEMKMKCMRFAINHLIFFHLRVRNILRDYDIGISSKEFAK